MSAGTVAGRRAAPGFAIEAEQTYPTAGKKRGTKRGRD